jgi:phosphatidylserine decarboxylase
VPGNYYSDGESEGEDPGGLNDSQGYTTAVATPAIIVIDCDDVAIGPVGCVFVGMADVSSCMIEALPGQRVRKRDELGYFQRLDPLSDFPARRGWAFRTASAIS